MTEIADEATGRFGRLDTAVEEGDIFEATVYLHEKWGVAVSVDYATVDGTATAPDDYLPISGTLTFNPGVTALTITGLVVDDSEYEPVDEYFDVVLSNPTAGTIIDGTGRVWIKDNDDPPSNDPPPVGTLSINT